MQKIITSFILLSLFLAGCSPEYKSGGRTASEIRSSSLEEAAEEKTESTEYVIRESSVSPNGAHRISVFVTRDQGMGLWIDGEEWYFDDIVIRYSPAISDEGKAVWAQQQPGYGYDVMLEGESVLNSGACLDFVKMGSSKGIFAELDSGKDLTRLYLIDTKDGSCKCFAWLLNEYMEEICRYGTDKFGVITCCYDSKGNKLYNVYQVDGEKATAEKIIADSSELITFPVQQSENLRIDRIHISNNERYLYNALRIVGGINEAFAYGNDFRGRMSWSESGRLRGLCELYKKTQTAELRARITDIVVNIMDARNGQIGIPVDEWNPGYLWTAKAYSIANAPVCIIIENSEILSALLSACNDNIITEDLPCYQAILATAALAYEYYGQWYKDGHYALPKGYPMANDGMAVPWNFQNSFAEVCLGLYLETGAIKYLERCNEIISEFQTEWTVEGSRIYWHYWPEEYYAGWEMDGRSVNTPEKEASEDTLFEDASHAGITVRLLSRYYDNIPDGVVSKDQLDKIEENMEYFCFTDGFSRFISGDEEYVPRRWHYWISPYFSYLNNDNYEQYVCQGYRLKEKRKKSQHSTRAPVNCRFHRKIL